MRDVTCCEWKIEKPITPVSDFPCLELGVRRTTDAQSPLQAAIASR